MRFVSASIILTVVLNIFFLVIAQEGEPIQTQSKDDILIGNKGIPTSPEIDVSKLTAEAEAAKPDNSKLFTYEELRNLKVFDFLVIVTLNNFQF
jgi:hypothetical protein